MADNTPSPITMALANLPSAAPADETPAPAAAPPEVKAPEKDQFSEKFNLLAKKERMIARERMRIAQEKKETEEKFKKYQGYEESKAKAKQNPLDFLKEAGLSYDELTQYLLNGGKPTEIDEIKSVRSELEEFKRQQAEEKKQQQEFLQKQQQQQHEQAISGFKTDIAEFIEANKDKYELIASRDGAEDIFNAVNDAFILNMTEWQKNGKQGPPPKVMEIEEAAQVIEEFYEEEVKRLTSTNKWKTKYGQPQMEPSPKAKPSPTPTLTNQMTTSAAASLVPAKNDAERIARALAKLG